MKENGPQASPFSSGAPKRGLLFCSQLLLGLMLPGALPAHVDPGTAPGAGHHQGPVIVGGEGHRFETVPGWGELPGTIAPQCRGFHAMDIGRDNRETVIYGAQLQDQLRVCKIDTKGNLYVQDWNATGRTTKLRKF